jgi:flagellar hook-length control protein FliK
MRTEKAEGPQEPNNGKQQRDVSKRPRRGGKQGPLGFGSVLGDVRGDGKGEGLTGSTTVGQAGFDPTLALAAQADAGAKAARSMGAVEGAVEQLNDSTFGVQDATEALAQQDHSPTAQAQVQPHVPTPLGRMTPAGLIETVLDEATKLDIERASRDLHVELEPEDLGPVVVRLRKGPDGTLDIGFRARQGDAARMLESGSTLLRDKLATAGFLTVSIDVQHDADLQLTGITTGR